MNAAAAPLIDTETTPTAWLTERLPRRFDDYASDPSIGPWYTVQDVLADGAALLRTSNAFPNGPANPATAPPASSATPPAASNANCSGSNARTAS